MAKLKHGTAEITLPSELKDLPEQAGSLTSEQMQKIPKARRGLGLACDHAADALRKAGSNLTVDADLTPESFEEAGQRAELIDTVIQDVEVMLNKLKQSNLLLDDEAYTKLRRLNDTIKAQAKYKPELLIQFAALLAYFQNK